LAANITIPAYTPIPISQNINKNITKARVAQRLARQTFIFSSEGHLNVASSNLAVGVNF
jgi:hypothetical protein